MQHLQAFLDSAPAQLHASRPRLNPSLLDGDLPTTPPSRTILRFKLSDQEGISCILWEDKFYITSTDILRIIAFRLKLLGGPGPLLSWKKLEGGVFSDLRNLKEGHGSIMLESKSKLLQLLFQHRCVRSQKKQKIFLWQSVPHEQLYRSTVNRHGLLPSVVIQQPRLLGHSSNASRGVHSTQQRS
ncbi:BZ3501_MvSof-1269-A2-R1_Chr12-3g03623 [Microbotryum saponariae]|nr:BZ3501_MvSof-1269-A2-R1_Chr12-3g03623 [Microbotryum saponariae]